MEDDPAVTEVSVLANAVAAPPLKPLALEVLKVPFITTLPVPPTVPAVVNDPAASTVMVFPLARVNEGDVKLPLTFTFPATLRVPERVTLNPVALPMVRLPLAVRLVAEEMAALPLVKLTFPKV